MHFNAYVCVCSSISNSFETCPMAHVLYWGTLVASVLLLIVVVWPLVWSSAERFHRKHHKFLATFTSVCTRKSKMLNGTFTNRINFGIAWNTERKLLRHFFFNSLFFQYYTTFYIFISEGTGGRNEGMLHFSVHCSCAASWTAWRAQINSGM